MSPDDHGFHMWHEPGCPACEAKREESYRQELEALAGPEGATYDARFWEHVRDAVETGKGLALSPNQARMLYEAKIGIGASPLALVPAVPLAGPGTSLPPPEPTLPT